MWPCSNGGRVTVQGQLPSGFCEAANCQTNASVTASAQVGRVTYGTPGSATYTVTVTRQLGTSTSSSFSATVSQTATLPEVEEEFETRTRKQPPYHVVLLNDDDHSYAYVVLMLKELFGYPVEKGFRMAEEVDRTGRAVVLTTSREHAELKQDQIHAFGPDKDIPRCKGSMSAEIEPAE